MFPRIKRRNTSTPPYYTTVTSRKSSEHSLISAHVPAAGSRLPPRPARGPSGNPSEPSNIWLSTQFAGAVIQRAHPRASHRLSRHIGRDAGLGLTHRPTDYL